MKHARLFSGLVFSAVVALASTARADVVNGDFESGTSPWVAVNGGVGSAGGDLTSPGSGSYGFAETTASSPIGFIGQTGIQVTAAAPILSFAYNFFTNEADTGFSLFNLTVKENGTTQTFTIASASSDMTSPGPTTAAGSYGRQTGNQTATFDLSAFIGSTVSLSFQVIDLSALSGTPATSGFAVDNVQLQAVPEPSTTVSLLGAVACIAGWQLRRRKGGQVSEPATVA